MNHIKNRLKIILDTRFNGNQSEMARELNYSQPTIRNYIEADRLPKYDFIFKLCVTLGISPNWLILGIGNSSLSENQIKNAYVNFGNGDNTTQVINNNSEYQHIHQIEMLNEKVESLKKENELLREINSILKQATTK